MKFLAHLFFWVALLAGGLGLASAQFRLALPIISFGLVAGAMALGGFGFFLSLIAILRNHYGRTLLALFMLVELPCLALVGYGVWRGSLHPINDVTTDVKDVPEFIQPLAMFHIKSGAEYITDAPLLERKYDPSFAAIQKNIYGEIAPSTQKIAPTGALEAVKKTIMEAFPNWKIVKEDAKNHVLQAEAETGFFHFIDDVVIHITALSTDEPLSRIDMRSRSRYGRSDYGFNANRITRFLVQLRARVDQIAVEELKRSNERKK